MHLQTVDIRLSTYKGMGVSHNNEIISPKKHRKEARRIAVSPRQIQIPEFKLRIKQSGFKPIPVSTLTIKIVSILLGRVDAGVYFPQEGKSANIWDYAAALLLLKEFGGKITSLDGSVMPFNDQGIVHKNGWLASSYFCNHDELLKNLQ